MIGEEDGEEISGDAAIVARARRTDSGTGITP
jgi:hypothetical protein